MSNAEEDFRADIRKRDDTIGWLRDENTRLKAQVTSLLTTLTQDECHCDPPGSGEEYCTGECILRAEIAQLRADLARWKPSQCGKIYPMPIAGEVVKACGREVDHPGAHLAVTGEAWVATT